ncbi:MAG: cation diffusion facilitator family transporter [Suipraeoptans sp.]
MTDFLIKHFVNDYSNVKKAHVRTSYGILTGVVGIVLNALLFLGKFITGVFLGSVSVMADAFNNLSDAGSSVIGLVGIKLAQKPADSEHPFGHGRVEYISALVVAFIILQVGFSFLKESIEKIRNPQDLSYSHIAIIILVISILVKIWISVFNRKIGKKIDSQIMMATAGDSIGDVVVTSGTLISILIYKITGLNIDGFMGVLVSCVVMWAGFSVAKDTLTPLIGEAVSYADYKKISDFVESYTGILGSHDLIIHNYGPGRSMASIHAEVPNDVDIEISHEVIDRIERDAIKELGTFLVIHMDPIETKDKIVLRTRNIVKKTVHDIDEGVTMHDFRMVHGENRSNLVFDLVIPYEYSDDDKHNLVKEVEKRLKEVDSRYECVITVDRSYIMKQ